MASINFKILKSILLVFLLPIYGVKTITEEELAPFFETFKQQMFQQILKATKDIPDIVTAIQGTEVISRLLSKAFNPNWHELRKQEKCSSLAPPRSKFYNTQ